MWCAPFSAQQNDVRSQLLLFIIIISSVWSHMNTYSIISNGHFNSIPSHLLGASFIFYTWISRLIKKLKYSPGCISFAVRWPALLAAQVSEHVELHSPVQVKLLETQSVDETEMQVNYKLRSIEVQCPHSYASKTQVMAHLQVSKSIFWSLLCHICQL